MRRAQSTAAGPTAGPYRRPPTNGWTTAGL